MRATAAIASLFVLLAGLGVGTYFIVFRTAGVQPQSPGLELAILAAAVLALAVVTNLAIVSAGKRAGGGEVQRLLGRALEIDATDPDAVREFASVPALRDLVAGWVSERAHVRELSDRIEVLRGEMDGIADGMRRSSQDLGRIREQPSSPLGVQIVATWNTMVGRLKQADAKATASVAAPTSSAGADAEPIVRTLVARLDELESELDRLRGHVEDAPALEILGNEVERAPSAPFASTPAASRRVTGSDEQWGEVEVVEPLPRTRAWQVVADDESTLFAPEASDSRARGLFAPEPSERQAPAPVNRGASLQAPGTAPAAQPGDPRFEDLDFPHFVGKAVRTLDDRVAVTYEGQDAVAEGAELPANALLFDDEELADEPPVFDLGRLATPERER